MILSVFTWIVFQGIPVKAMTLSLLLPGAGEVALGYPRAAIPFFGVETASWIAAFTLNRYTYSVKEEYIQLAYRYAGANIQRKDESYWKAVEFYPSRGAYIEALLLEARSYFPDDYQRQLDYVRAHDPGDDWNWDEESHWYRFQELRQRFRAFQDWTTVSLGILVGNRIASVINVFLLSRSQGRIGVTFHGDPTQVQASFRIFW